MTRRALLIGSQTYGLQGCDADVALMRETLERRGFEVDVRTAADASRAGIADGLERLISASGPADAAVLYYSGHGGRVVRPDAEDRRASGLSVHYQFLVPFDIDASEQGDFRGLLSEELTAYQRRLTNAFIAHGAVPNVTTILDCCHSGYAARDATLIPKFVELEPRMFRMMGIRARAEQFSGGGGVETNPYAVRLVACQEEQSAYERASPRGGHHGVFTDALVSVLDEFGEHVSWAVVGDALRRKVAIVTHDQRPEVEGPSSRLLFSPDDDAGRRSFPVARRGATWVIEAAVLLGLGDGDTMLLETVSPQQRVATAVVGAIERGDAVLEIALDAGVTALPEDVRAVPQLIRGARSRVAVRVDGAMGALLRERIDLSPVLTTDESEGPATATVVDDGGLVVLGDTGAPMRAPEADDDTGRQRVVDVLELLGHARRLRDLRSPEGEAALAGPVEVRLASIRDGVRTERPLHGQRFDVGDRVAVTLENQSEWPRYFWVFDIGISGRVEMITGGAPSGTLLGPSGAPDASRELFTADGSAVRWPSDVPRRTGAGADERSETLLIVLADRRQDLTGLVTAVAVGRGTPDSELARGDTTDPVVADAPFRYRIVTISFLVTPPA